MNVNLLGFSFSKPILMDLKNLIPKTHIPDLRLEMLLHININVIFINNGNIKARENI